LSFWLNAIGLTGALAKFLPSRFQVVKWLPGYLGWYFYAFATTYPGRPPRTVRLKHARQIAAESQNDRRIGAREQ
jgi:hypothetical protein